jgi:lipid-binding SYLF domain-containing protein
MSKFWISQFLALAVVLIVVSDSRAASPNAKVEGAANVLKEMLSAPASGIPQAMLSDAQGLVIISQVIKIGFIIGGQRGEGVVLVRDENGAWSLPRFVTLTAGSVGWQIGVESSDFVIVFKTRKSVEGLMKGKFTIGADANAAIGPVGRQIGAATDGRLGAEIYTYARSRGLFAGVSLAGSVLELDAGTDATFYGVGGATQIPESAARLVELVSRVSGGDPNQPLQPVALEQPTGDTIEQLRQNAADTAKAMDAILSPEWRRYFSLPKELFVPGQALNSTVLRSALQRFDTVVANPQYRALTSRPEFSAAHAALAQLYNGLVAVPQAQLNLPPPPAGAGVQLQQ